MKLSPKLTYIVADSVQLARLVLRKWRNEQVSTSEIEMLKIGECSVRLDFNGDEEREAQSTTLCLDVLKHFEFLQQRIDCFFAVADDYYLISDHGPHFRGFQVSYLGRHLMPQYLSGRFLHPYDGNTPPPSFEDQLAFDQLVYIRNTTCLDPIGMVLTLAHELQHVVQHWRAPKVLTAGHLLYENIRVMRGTANLSVVDIPQERDANITSKRIAEIVCGLEAVKLFADGRVKQFEELAKLGDDSAASERARWEFFRDVPSSTDYNWAEEIKTLIARCKQEIVSQNVGLNYGLNFTKEEWWKDGV